MMLEYKGTLYNLSKYYKFKKDDVCEKYYINCFGKTYIEKSFIYETEEERNEAWEKIKKF